MVHREKKSCVKSSKTHSNYESKWWIEKLIVLFNHCNNEAHTMFRLIPGLCVVWHVFIFHSVQISWDQNKSIATCIGILYFEMNDLLFLIFLRLFLRLTAAYTCQPGIIGFYTGGTIFCICRIYNYIFSTCLTIWSTVAHVSWWHHTHSPGIRQMPGQLIINEKWWWKCERKKMTKMQYA